MTFVLLLQYSRSPLAIVFIYRNTDLSMKSFTIGCKRVKEKSVFCEVYCTEFRFESPISISKWNNCLDFRRKSENYFKVKIFSDSRPKSAQKLILKVFADFQTKIICRLSKIFKIFIWCYTCARMGFLFAHLLWDQKRVRWSGKPIRWSLYGRFLGYIDASDGCWITFWHIMMLVTDWDDTNTHKNVTNILFLSPTIKNGHHY